MPSVAVCVVQRSACAMPTAERSTAMCAHVAFAPCCAESFSGSPAAPPFRVMPSAEMANSINRAKSAILRVRRAPTVSRAPQNVVVLHRAAATE